MKRKNRLMKWALALAAAGSTFVTTGTCDPYTGYLDFYRDDDSDDYYYDDYFYDDGYYDDDPYYYDDCFLFCF